MYSEEDFNFVTEITREEGWEDSILVQTPAELEALIPAETRTYYKTLYADPDPGYWDWDDSTWRWELSLRETEPDYEHGREWGYLFVAPYKDGKRIRQGTVPDLDHRGWLIGNIDPTIRVIATLGKAKAVLDNLIQPTPLIPFYTIMNIPPEAPVLSIEEFKTLTPGDLIGEQKARGTFVVERVIADYPGPLACRIYARDRGGSGSLIAFTLTNHRERSFVRLVREPLRELRTLIAGLEKGWANYDVGHSIGISRGQIDCLGDIVKNYPELVAALLDGTLSLDQSMGIVRDEQDRATYQDGELVYAVTP